jgi:hypothetical protein
MILALAAFALLEPQVPSAVPAPVVTTVGTARIRVVRGPDRVPVAGAEVRSYQSPEHVGLWWGDSAYSQLDTALQKTIPLGSTDERGEIVVAVGGYCTLVEAHFANLWGALTASEETLPTSSVREVELSPDFDLEVRVVDAHGQPLGGVLVAHRVEYTRNGPSYRSDELLRATDVRGVALLRHVGIEMHASDGVDGYRHSIAVAGCVSPAVEVLVDPVHPPTAPILLRMPPTGEIEAVFEEADGTPIRIDGDCALAWASAEAEPRAYPPFPGLLGLRNPGVEVIERPGTNSVVFRRVSLDGDWDLWMQRNVISKAACARIRGPHSAGERVRAVIHPADVALLEGQFVDEKGAPRGVVEFSVQSRWMPPQGGWPLPSGAGNVVYIGDDAGPEGPREYGLGGVLGLGLGPAIQTDGHGRFRIDFDSAWYDVGELYLTFVEDRGQNGERSVCIQYKKNQYRGLVELGKLVLPASPVIAAGTVRDAAGQPLGDVFVEGSSTHNQRYRFSTRSAADGSFCLRGACFEEITDVRFRRTGFEECKLVLKMGCASQSIVMSNSAPSVK